jgi:hypothetical protein
MVQKASRALHFVMHIVKRGNKNTKSMSIHVASMSYSRIQGGILGFIPKIADKRFRPSMK